MAAHPLGHGGATRRTLRCPVLEVDADTVRNPVLPLLVGCLGVP
jgi:hypothetical protein